MDFNLDSLFREPPSTDGRSGDVSCQVAPNPVTHTRRDNMSDSDDAEDMSVCAQTMLEGTTSGFYEDHINKLTKELNDLRMQAEEHARFVVVLEKRIASKTASLPPRDPDIVNRLKFLEQENRRLSTKNKALEEEVCNLKRGKTLAEDENDEKSRKLRGANKKVRNAKDVAAKEKERADGALYEKKLRLESERKMRKELKSEEAKVAGCEKEIESLKSKTSYGDGRIRSPP